MILNILIFQGNNNKTAEKWGRGLIVQIILHNLNINMRNKQLKLKISRMSLLIESNKAKIKPKINNKTVRQIADPINKIINKTRKAIMNCILTMRRNIVRQYRSIQQIVLRQNIQVIKSFQLTSLIRRRSTQWMIIHLKKTQKI